MNTLNNAPQRKYLSKTQKVSLYVFFGCLTAALLVLSLTILSYLYTFLIINEPFATVTGPLYWILGVSLIFHYPAAIIIGGIPAMLTGIVINELSITVYQKSDAFIVSFIFYSTCYLIFGASIDQSMLAAVAVSLVGGFAAACTMRLIEKKELNF